MKALLEGMAHITVALAAMVQAAAVLGVHQVGFVRAPEHLEYFGCLVFAGIGWQYAVISSTTPMGSRWMSSRTVASTLLFLTVAILEYASVPPTWATPLGVAVLVFLSSMPTVAQGPASGVIHDAEQRLGRCHAFLRMAASRLVESRDPVDTAPHASDALATLTGAERVGPVETRIRASTLAVLDTIHRFRRFIHAGVFASALVLLVVVQPVGSALILATPLWMATLFLQYGNPRKAPLWLATLGLSLTSAASLLPAGITPVTAGILSTILVAAGLALAWEEEAVRPHLPSPVAPDEDTAR